MCTACVFATLKTRLTDRIRVLEGSKSMVSCHEVLLELSNYIDNESGSRAACGHRGAPASMPPLLRAAGQHAEDALFRRGRTHFRGAGGLQRALESRHLQA